MYITNIDEISENRKFKTNGVIANWLINEKNIPLMGKSKSGEFIFARTDLLEEILKDIPFYLNITKVFS